MKPIIFRKIFKRSRSRRGHSHSNQVRCWWRCPRPACDGLLRSLASLLRRGAAAGWGWDGSWSWSILRELARLLRSSLEWLIVSAYAVGGKRGRVVYSRRRQWAVGSGRVACATAVLRRTCSGPPAHLSLFGIWPSTVALPWVFQSMSRSFFKSHSLNYHLKSYLYKNYFLYFFHSPTVFLYLIRTIESHSCLPFFASEKSGIKDDYIWMTI
jgi:hypothetical protein